MSKRNRKEIVEQDKNKSEEITNENLVPESTSDSQNGLIDASNDEDSHPNDRTRMESETETQQGTDEAPLKILEDKLAEMNDKYLRLSAEFDNYRKRTMRERADLIKSAGEDILYNILPVLDNFERALISINNSKDTDAIKAGILLIYSKFKEFLSQKGIKEIDTLNKPFDADLYDAITKIPVHSKDQQGLVMDVVEKGYYLNDKIIRHSKVVVGEYKESDTSIENQTE